MICVRRKRIPKDFLFSDTSRWFSTTGGHPFVKPRHLLCRSAQQSIVGQQIQIPAYIHIVAFKAKRQKSTIANVSPSQDPRKQQRIDHSTCIHPVINEAPTLSVDFDEDSSSHILDSIVEGCSIEDLVAMEKRKIVGDMNCLPPSPNRKTPVTMVHNESSLEKLKESIRLTMETATPRQPLYIGVDCRGTNMHLGRLGNIELLMLQFGPPAIDSEQIYCIDFQDRDFVKNFVIENTIKEILQKRNIVKIFYRSASICDNLFRNYNILVTNVHDLEIWHLTAQRRSKVDEFKALLKAYRKFLWPSNRGKKERNEYTPIKKIYDNTFRSQHWSIRPLTEQALLMAVSDIEFFLFLANLQKTTIVKNRTRQRVAVERSTLQAGQLRIREVETNVKLEGVRYGKFVGVEKRKLRNLMMHTCTIIIEVDESPKKDYTKFAIWYKDVAGLTDVKVNMGHDLIPKPDIPYKSLKIQDDKIHYEKKRFNDHGHWKPWLPYSKPSFMLVGTKAKHLRLRKLPSVSPRRQDSNQDVP